MTKMNSERAAGLYDLAQVSYSPSSLPWTRFEALRAPENYNILQQEGGKSDLLRHLNW